MEPDIDPRISNRVMPMEYAASQRATSQKMPTNKMSKALDLKKTEKLKGGRGAGSSPSSAASASRRSGSRTERTGGLAGRTGSASGRVSSRVSSSPSSSAPTSPSAAPRPKGSGAWLTRSGSPMVESESFRRGKISTSSSAAGVGGPPPAPFHDLTGPAAAGQGGGAF